SMVAARDWARWHEIDLRALDVPLEAAQAYVREHVMDAMWAIPIVPRQCAIQIEAFEQMFIRILVDRDGATWIVDTRMDGDTGAWVHDAMLEILLHVRGLILTLRGIKREYETISPPLRYESLTYSAI